MTFHFPSPTRRAKTQRCWNFGLGSLVWVATFVLSVLSKHFHWFTAKKSSAVSMRLNLCTAHKDGRQTRIYKTPGCTSDHPLFLNKFTRQFVDRNKHSTLTNWSSLVSVTSLKSSDALNPDVISFTLWRLVAYAFGVPMHKKTKPRLLKYAYVLWNTLEETRLQSSIRFSGLNAVKSLYWHVTDDMMVGESAHFFHSFTFSRIGVFTRYFPHIGWYLDISTIHDMYHNINSEQISAALKEQLDTFI